MTTFRAADGGRIDRSTTLAFQFDGQDLTGHPGDTLASALLAAGRHRTGTSIALGRPRGIGAAWAEDPGGLVQITEPFPEPMLLAATVELFNITNSNAATSVNYQYGAVNTSRQFGFVSTVIPPMIGRVGVEFKF